MAHHLGAASPYGSWPVSCRGPCSQVALPMLGRTRGIDDPAPTSAWISAAAKVGQHAANFPVHVASADGHRNISVPRQSAELVGCSGAHLAQPGRHPGLARTIKLLRFRDQLARRI